MPPFVPRKRSHTPEPNIDRPAKRHSDNALKAGKKVKQTLFDTVDSPTAKLIDVEHSRRVLAKLAGSDDDDDSSEANSDDFEDVADVQHVADHEDEDEEMEWEDATPVVRAGSNQDEEIGDVSVALKEDGSYVEPLVSAATGKKGPSKKERQIRDMTHAIHVQALLFHNTVRNSWLNDKELQSILHAQLSPVLLGEIKQFKRSMGMLSQEELEYEKAAALAKKQKNKKGRPKKELKGRDWSYSADFTEVGTMDMSHGDPCFRLLKMMSLYWQKRFTITAPGLRKKGYMPLPQLRNEMKSWEKDSDQEQHGERVPNIEAFRQLARSCEGSRDVGGQLFVALLRAIGLDVRMVVSLQPAGFGWSKSEEASAKVAASETIKAKPTSSKAAKQLPPPKLREALTPKQGKKEPQRPARKSTRGDQTRPINLDESESDLSAPPTDIDDQTDDISILDVHPLSKKRPAKTYDRDLPFPTYWAEVRSPATNKFVPVDAVVIRTIGSNDELVASFEPRGSKADKGKQVICYVIGYNADGSAKDVTIRYLKRHQLPGKTKGVRMPVVKMPIYNNKGKVKKYEEHDWFAELMVPYHKDYTPRTPAEILEDQNELKPWKPAKEEKVLDKESLAWYKASAEFVLEEHLRREEALLPGAKPVKKFTAGKGEKAKDHKVFKRADVVSCKTVESWHKEGRELIAGEQPLKYVPIRAVTLQRKREIEDAERETGEKLKQGLYSEAQTDWIIPDPIVGGVIPKNAYGNMDVYVPTMVPAGAKHLPMKGTAKICRKLGIDHAEACTGFEFGNKRAVPIITGVVVAKENAELVRNAWKVERAEQQRKEDVKRTAAALHWWRKMLMGLRIIDRMRAEYANTATEDEYNPFVRKAAAGSISTSTEVKAASKDTGGGFLLDDYAEPDDHHEDVGGGFLVEDEAADEGVTDDRKLTAQKGGMGMTPVSLQSLHDETDNFKATAITSKSRSKKANKIGNAKKSMIKLEDDESELSDFGGAAPVQASSRSKKLRVSPIKSPYFSSQDVKDESELDGVEEEEEVIAPRRTTARSRRQ